MGVVNLLSLFSLIAMETETECRLPFLEVLVKRDGNHLMSSIYRKRTHTDSYNFHHHPRTKKGVISCLQHKAHNLCKNDDTKVELHHLQKIFELNDSPPGLVINVLHKRRNKPIQNPTASIRKKVSQNCWYYPPSEVSVRGLNELSYH